MMYRYVSHWMDFDDSDLFYRLKDYAQRHFLNVIDQNNLLSFTATPAQLKEACRLHGIDPCFISMVVTDDLVPMQVIEVEHA